MRNNKYIKRFESLVTEYGIDNVKEKLLLLGDKHRAVLEYYFAIDKDDHIEINDIAKNLQISRTIVYYFLNEGLEKLSFLLSEHRNSKVDRYGFYELVKKHGKEKIYKILFILDIKEAEIIKSYYGIDCESKSTKEIATELVIARNTVSAILAKAVEKLKSIAENNTIDYGKKYRLRRLVLKYGQEEVLERLILLCPLKEQKMFCYYFGLEKQAMPHEELALKYDISLSDLVKRVGIILNNLEIDFEKKTFNSKHREHFIEILKKYSDEEIRKAVFSSCDDKERFIICSYYGICDYEKKKRPQIAESLNVSNAIVGRILYQKEVLIKNKLQGNFIAYNSSNKIKELRSIYGDERLKAIIQLLKEEERKIIELYCFGKDNRRFTQIEIARELGLKENCICNLIKAIIMKIEDILEQIDKGHLYLTSVINSNESLKQEIEELSLLDVVIFAYIYLDDSHKLSKTKISNLFGIDLSIVEKSINKTSKFNIETRSKQKIVITKDYYDLISEYGKERVINEIRTLPKMQKDILFMIYGIENDKAYEVKEIADIYQCDKSHIINNLHRGLDKIYRNLSCFDEKKDREKGFFALFSPCDIDVVISILSKLNINEKDLILDYYGLGRKKMLKKEINSKYGISLDMIDYYVAKIIKEMKKKANSVAKILSNDEKKQNFKSRINSDDKEEIQQALELLDDEEYEILSLYYGFNDMNIFMSLRELSEKKDIPQLDLMYLIDKSINIINEYLSRNRMIVKKNV